MPYTLTRFTFAICVLFALSACVSTPEKKTEFVPPVYPSPPDEPRIIYERTIFHSADIEEFSSTDRWRQIATGQGKAARPLSKPWGVAVHRGRVFVSDTAQRVVMMFDIPGKRFKMVGDRGAGKLMKPVGIDISKSGEVYVADATARRVAVYNLEGEFINAIGGEKYLERPTGVAVNREGTRAYVVDNGGISSRNHRVVIFDTKSGEHIKTFGVRGNGEGEFNMPLQATFNKDGNLYVVDSANFRVQIFDADGNFKDSFGKIGIRMGQFSRPKGIADDPDGNIYVADASFSNVQVFKSDGQLLMFFGGRATFNQPGGFMLMAGMDIDEDGRIYIVDQYFRKIDVFRPYAMKATEGYAASPLLKEK